ncbi:MAG: zinc ribbon domain-containing protein, partial [Actinobacteria bacterium]|nr:zinc ribbon domain-containing protein [Actinomycetota bacterium]
FLKCPYCGKFITGSWSKGKTKRYAYYHCVTSGCQFGNIRKEIIEGEFIKTLEKLQPKEKVLDLFSEILNEVWEEKQKDQYILIRKLENDIKELKNKKNKIADLAIKCVFDDMTFKEQNEIVENEIILKTIQLNELSLNYDDISKCVNSCEYFLKNLSQFWLTSDLLLKQKFQKIIFLMELNLKMELLELKELALYLWF